MKPFRFALAGLAFGLAVAAVDVTIADARSVSDIVEQVRAWLYPRRIVPAQPPVIAPAPKVTPLPRPAPEPEPEPIVEAPPAPEPPVVVEPEPVKAKPAKKRAKAKPRRKQQGTAATNEWLPPCATVCWYAAGKTRAALAAEARSRNPSAAMRRHAMACLAGCRG